MKMTLSSTSAWILPSESPLGFDAPMNRLPIFFPKIIPMRSRGRSGRALARSATSFVQRSSSSS